MAWHLAEGNANDHRHAVFCEGLADLKPVYPLKAAHGDLSGRTILQIIPRLDESGAARGIVAIAEGLINAGARALVASGGGPLVADLQARGAVSLELPLDTQNPLRLMGNAFRLRALIRHERVELLHVRARGPAWSAMFANRHAKVPTLVSWMPEGGQRKSGSLYPSILAKADRIILPGEYLRESIVRTLPVEDSQLSVIRRPIDLSAFDPAGVAPARIAAMRGIWDIGPDDKAVLVASRVAEGGVSQMLAEVTRQLASHGPAAPYFVQSSTVTDMPAAMLAAHGLVILAQQADHFGRLAVEAQALGVPVIVVGAGAAAENLLAPPEAPAAQRSGWRVPADDAAALASALVELLSLRPSQRSELAEHARRHAGTNFSMDQLVAATLDLYGGLLAPVL